MSADEREQNKQVVTRWLDLLCNEKRVDLAVKELLGEHYIQHAFGQPDGGDQLLENMPKMYAANPDLHTTIHRLVAEDDLVAAHHHLQLRPGEPGLQVMDIFRLADGKIVEHWDVVAEIPKGSPGNSGVF
jgi:predicted SnoaL-like aldol condensation-catalyzing enzyme